MIDISIENGMIIDGSGKHPYSGTILIHNKKIADILPHGFSEFESKISINAFGCFISPGWIDCHSHSDVIYFSKKWQDHKTAQGVTTEIVGNCGYSVAPFPGKDFLSLHIDHDIYNFKTMGEYLDIINGETASCPVHISSLVGHGNIRASVLGSGSIVPSRTQIAKMEAILDENMSAGALGLSTGLAYPPGSFAGTDELIALAKIAARRGGIYVTHMRNEDQFLEEAVKESVKIAQKADIPLHISHLKAVGRPNFNKLPQILDMLEKRIHQGMDISFDMYPYPAGSTTLTLILPEWITIGGKVMLTEHLRNPGQRRRLHDQMGTLDEKTGQRLYNGCTWDKIIISSVVNDYNNWMNGKSIREIAQQQGKDPLDATLDLIEDESGQTMAIYHSLSEDNVWKVLKNKFSLVGSDGLALGNFPHPRLFGTFPRFMNHAVNNHHLISLESAVEKLTSKVAKRFNLKNKGLLKKGMDADITVFDLKKLRDRATFDNPTHPPEGIECVIVKGVIKKGN
jgi:N-acyl-D-amino-acid deacylase